MKKIILPVVLFILFLLFPLNISAQSAADKCFKKKYDECNRKYQSDSCGSNVGANYVGWAACQESLLDKIKKCEEEISSEYQPCKETGGSTTPTQTSSTKESESEDCWGKYMAADGCSPQYAACTRECPKDASTAQRVCEEACSKTSRACRDESSANYRACVAANTKSREEGTKSELQDQPQAPIGQPVGQSEFENKGNIFSIFGVNPFETWLNLRAVAQLPETFLDAMTVTEILVLEGLGKSGWVKNKYGDVWHVGDKAKQYNQKITEIESKTIFKYSDLPKRTPEMTKKIIEQYRQEREEMMGSGQKEASPYSIDILKGQAQIRYPNENQWKDVEVGEKIPQGATLFTGMDTTTILTIEGVGVVEIAPFTEVKIDQSGIEQAKAKKEIFTDINLKKGEIEVNVERGVFTAPILDVHTPNATTSIRGTHFWVSYKDNQTAVGVYEGKVEVKTDDGGIQEVTPNGDQPGVMVVSQKLSLIKLVITGSILVAIIGGGILLLKRKFAAKGYSKKKR